MPHIKIIRAAFREIQKLPPLALQNVYKILHRLSQGDYRHTKALEGYDSLRRTRLDNIRVIWERTTQDNIVAIKAGLRGDVYDKMFDSRDRTCPRTIEELLYPQGISLAETPAYQWNQEEDEAWYRFVYGGYRYSPILTQHQRNVLDDLLKPVAARWGSDTTWIVQSAPGTGKTVCATLLGCEIHQNFEWNTMLIVPEALRKDVAEYAEVKQALQQQTFWLGTFREWLSQQVPELRNRLAAPKEELQALLQATSLTRRASISMREIRASDVLLYQAFVLDDENRKQGKNAISKVNLQRVEKLERIDRKIWKQALSLRFCRLDAVKQLRLKLPAPPRNADHTILIVDEAQDFLLAELQALIAVCQAWESQGHPTYLWLLGDLNQRIQPTDFDWGQLHLGKPLEIRRNYRNSQRILEFANQFWEVAQQINSSLKCKQLPEPARPEDAVEVGEAVHLLVCSSLTEAMEFLEQLAQESEQEKNRRYLLRDLANAVKVLSPTWFDSHDSLVILNAERAKGREFEACVAFRMFEGAGKPSLEESFQWYTLLTRARSRLLVVATTAEIERIGSKYFAACDRIDAQRAIGWITEVASDVDLSQITDDVQRRLLERCESGHLYWDTYLALQLAGVEGDRLYQWEREAISLLNKHSLEYLQAELQQTERIPLRCLLFRAMQHSWQAVLEASQLKATDWEQSVWLLESIARDLELKNLPYEAARVRLHLGDVESSVNLPFWEEASYLSNQFQPLVKLLCQSFTSRLDNFIQQREMKE